MSQSFCHNMENEKSLCYEAFTASFASNKKSFYRSFFLNMSILMFKKARKAENKTFWVIEDRQHLK